MVEKVEQVCFDKGIEPLDPATVEQVTLATRSDWIRDNLSVATEDRLSQEQLLRISGDNTPAHPGIDANNRLIQGQVFLWPEADGDWRVLWNDSQVFETREAYARFKASWQRHHKVWEETAVRLV